MIKFKSERIKSEFYDSRLDPRLKMYVYFLSGYIEDKYGANVLLTDILRTKKEQNEIYKNDKSYQKKPWDSVHQDWRGVDMVGEYDNGMNLTDEEHEEIESMINKAIQYNAAKSYNTAKYHNVGNGIHLHLQVFLEDETRLLK